MAVSSSINAQGGYSCVMTNVDIELVILAGIAVSLLALGAALVRSKRRDPKMAFLLALLQDLPAGSEETQESEEPDEANEPARVGSAPGSRISAFFA
jgi:hypothetical protein